METTFTIIRHGETAANRDGSIQGILDLPLDRAGEEQARALGRRWKGKRFDAVYSSDLSRAMRTAELVIPDHPAAPTPELREMDLGAWSGLPVSEVAARFPEEWRAFRSGSIECRAPGGESRREVLNRTDKFFREAAIRHPGKNVLVVTHGGVLRAFFILVAGGEKANFPLLPATANTGISTARFDPESGAWRLISWNDTAHLEASTNGDDAY